MSGEIGKEIVIKVEMMIAERKLIRVVINEVEKEVEVWNIPATRKRGKGEDGGKDRDTGHRKERMEITSVTITAN